MIFGSTRENALIRKIRLTSEFMTSQHGEQAIAIHILANNSWSKGNQAKKLGLLIEYNKRNIFLQKLGRKWGREISSRPLFIFFKSLIWRSAASFRYISIALHLRCNKNKQYKTLSRRYAQFWFFWKGSGTSYSTIFCT